MSDPTQTLIAVMAKVMQESYHRDKEFLEVDTVEYFTKLLRVGFAAHPSEIPVITDDMVETGCRAYMKAMHESFSPDHSIFEGGEPNWKLYIDGVRAILETLPKRESGGRHAALVTAAQNLLLALNTEMGTGITTAMAKVRAIIETEDSEIEGQSS